MKIATSLITVAIALGTFAGVAQAQSLESRLAGGAPNANGFMSPNNPATHPTGGRQSMPDSRTLMQKMAGTWTISTRMGSHTATYSPDGRLQGQGKPANSPRPIRFSGQWQAVPLDADCFKLSVRLDGMRQAAPPETLCFQPDGNLYNQTAQAMAYRVR